jgi:hypothetical protein
MRFEHKYTGEFPKPAFRWLDLFWAEYLLACERFDRRVCTGNRRGEAVPITVAQAGACYANARFQREVFLRQCAQEGYDVWSEEFRKEWLYVRKSVGRMSQAGLEEFAQYERLRKQQKEGTGTVPNGA